MRAYTCIPVHTCIHADTFTRIHIYVYMHIHVRFRIHVYTSPYAPSSLTAFTPDLPLCAFLAHSACSRDMPMCTGTRR